MHITINLRAISDDALVLIAHAFLTECKLSAPNVIKEQRTMLFKSALSEMEYRNISTRDLRGVFTKTCTPLPKVPRQGKRAGDWLPFSCGDKVCLKHDVRHIGVVEAIAHGSRLRIRWADACGPGRTALGYEDLDDVQHAVDEHGKRI